MTQTLTVIVPTYNEAGNVLALATRLRDALDPTRTGVGIDASVLFVDDSDDDTMERIQEAALLLAPFRVGAIHREHGERDGGLGGAVALGLRHADSEWAVVMDGDLQHPPELVPALLMRGRTDGADVVVASRYIGGGDAGGLANGVRRLVSSASTMLTRAMFPRRLRDCSDPMTGFFALRTAAVDLDNLRPRGFKILLEILARQDFKVVEEPFVFGERFDGESKANVKQGLHFLRQLGSLRFGRMSRFAIIGGVGTVLNLLIMAAVLGLGGHYLLAAILAAEITILTNFLLQDRLVFRDLHSRPLWQRLGGTFAFNNIETLVRIPFLALLVEALLLPELLAQAITLALAFLVRFTFVSRVIYGRRQATLSTPTIPLDPRKASA